MLILQYHATSSPRSSISTPHIRRNACFPTPTSMYPHRLAYIEAEMTKRRGALNAFSTSSEPFDPQAELYKIAERYKVEQRMIQAREEEEGNVTNSAGMLTSIPEVDLGMESVRLAWCCREHS
jgi:hypothetical protein